MKERWVVVAVLALAVFPATPASSWDFRLKGAFETIWEYYSQQGDNGFFGKYGVSVDAVSGATVATRNGWLGIDATRDATPFAQKHPGVVTGSNATRAVLKMELYPEFRLNEAIKIQGKYRIGGINLSQQWYNPRALGFPNNSAYVNSSATGPDNFFALGEWTTLWITAETPLGTITYGKRPWNVGCGLSYHGNDRSTESLALTLPFGALEFGIGIYPITLGYGDRFFDIERRSLFQPTSGPNLAHILSFAYWPSNFWDGNGTPEQYLAFVDYNATALSAGVGIRCSSTHVSSEGLPWVRSNPAAPSDVPRVDQSDIEAWVFAEYNNGRFFLNAEIDLFNRVRRFRSSASGRFFEWSEGALGAGSGSMFAPQYIESWRGMLETGIHAGPGRLTILYAHLPGPDRRHGILIDKQPTTYAYVPCRWDPANVNQHVGAASVFRPYSLLLGYDYGAGLNCVDVDGDGAITDASVLALRVDYAAAANLNVFGSFLYAERLSHAWQWGFIFPAPDSRGMLAFRNFRPGVPANEEFTNPVPTIPDTSLGWEITVGGDWQLLECWTLHATGAYWAPGRWFNFACVDKGVPFWWSHPSPANNWGTNPNRTIDPVVGLEVRLIAQL